MLTSMIKKFNNMSSHDKFGLLMTLVSFLFVIIALIILWRIGEGKCVNPKYHLGEKVSLKVDGKSGIVVRCKSPNRGTSDDRSYNVKFSSDYGDGRIGLKEFELE